MQGFVYSDLQEIDSGKMIIMVQQYCKIGVSLIGDQCEHNIVYSKCRSLLSHGMQNTFNGTVKPSLSGDIFGRKGEGRGILPMEQLHKIWSRTTIFDLI